MSDNVIEVRGICKHYGPTRGNWKIDFDVGCGEIRGLIGENGSGKSTLLNQIAGVVLPDSGTMTLNGKPYKPSIPVDANREKVSMVMQELGVADRLPVGVNVYLGRLEMFSKRGLLNKKKLYDAVTKVFEDWDLFRIPPKAPVMGMTIEMRKIVELARALSVEPDVLLLDEITQSLSMNNRNHLYTIIRKLRDMGKTVIMITHDVDETMEIADTITVLRDGELVGTVKKEDTTADELRRMMVGREISGDYYRADMEVIHEDEVVLTAESITIEGEIEDVSFELHKGEILGFCGLADSGISTVGKVVYGLAKPDSGSVRLGKDGKEITTAMEALSNNMGYVPKDRDREALMIHARILDNLTLPSLVELQEKLIFLRPSKMKKLSAGMVDKLSVKCTGILQPMDSLSGGNKQKVNLGRWLAKDLKILVLECPTRGVDVGVKAYIYEILKQTKEQGIATILISDELTEVLGMSDRLIVMKDGKVKRVIRRDEQFTEHSVIEVMI